ncbi:hypothetical protein NMY22_g6834 [Coprinellus aureogranulatus]|nr:hypothetical protein NMY22_g6834 [Coprinellus aureogranulatus]
MAPLQIQNDVEPAVPGKALKAAQQTTSDPGPAGASEGEGSGGCEGRHSKAKRSEPSERSGPKTSPTKRQRTTNAPSKARPTRTNPRRGQKNLSLLPTMPLDILYEILGALSPKDLLNLARTNKLWRKTILAENMKLVWAAARKLCGAPKPPENFSEAQWASLCFEKECQACGKAKAVTAIDWLLLRRTCNRCKKAHLISAKDIRARLPNVDKSILDYVPYTFNSGYTSRYHWYSPNAHTKWYWCEDVGRIFSEREKIDGASAIIRWQKARTRAWPGAMKGGDDSVHCDFSLLRRVVNNLVHVGRKEKHAQVSCVITRLSRMHPCDWRIPTELCNLFGVPAREVTIGRGLPPASAPGLVAYITRLDRV